MTFRVADSSGFRRKVAPVRGTFAGLENYIEFEKLCPKLGKLYGYGKNGHLHDEVQMFRILLLQVQNNLSVLSPPMVGSKKRNLPSQRN